MSDHLPEELELQRLETEQQTLTEQAVAAELKLETSKTELAQFRQRYHQTVGRLYAQLDAVEAQIAAAKAAAQPQAATLQAEAAQAQARARASAEEAGTIERETPAAAQITPELRQIFRKAASLMHPDRATTEPERLRRDAMMKKVNAAYQQGDMTALQKLIVEFGQDPEAVTGDDLGSRIVKAIRRISQLRKRVAEVGMLLAELQASEMHQLQHAVTEAESMGGTPLQDLAQVILQSISERQMELLDVQAVSTV